MKEINEQLIFELVNKLPEAKKEYLKVVLNSQRVVVQAKAGKTETEARKIVRPKARKVATNVDMNNEY
jgi:hypothetical protein